MPARFCRTCREPISQSAIRCRRCAQARGEARKPNGYLPSHRESLLSGATRFQEVAGTQIDVQKRLEELFSYGYMIVPESAVPTTRAKWRCQVFLPADYQERVMEKLTKR
jgi:hypothetical protein